MKRYLVVDGHTGDKTYVPGDTRDADPNAVQHLVDLGVLKEAEDQDGVDATEVPSSDDKDAQIAALTAERDAARAELIETQVAREQANEELSAAYAQIEALTATKEKAAAPHPNKSEPAPDNKSAKPARAN